MLIGTAAVLAVGLVWLPTAASAQRTAAAQRTINAAAASGPAVVQRVGHGADAAVISRNSYGVPSISAKSLSGMWFGAGWAQAQDRMVQLELTRRAVEGTLSALAGSAELGMDETVRALFYTPAEVRAQFNSLPAANRRALTAFSAGINAYEAAAYKTPASARAKVPYEFWVLGILLGIKGPYRPAPWTPEDSVAVGNYLARQFGGGGGSELQNLQFLQYLVGELTKRGDKHAQADAIKIFNDARWIDDTTAPTTVPGGTAGGAVAPGMSARDIATRRSLARLARVSHAALAGAAAKLAGDRRTILRTGISLRVLAHGGSNAIAVSPRLSADHHALLWGAPQEGFGTPSVDWEVYLHAPGYDAGGMAITGEPYVLIGRNSDSAWTTTSEEIVDERIYLESVNFKANPPTYLWRGRHIPMTAIHEKIAVHGSKPVSFTVFRTKDGPVFFTEPSQGLAFSIRFASWNRETGSLIGFSQLGGDRNLRQFRHSMSLITTLHNFIYADNRGNIAYFGDGLVPVGPSFAKVDPRLPALGNGTEQPTGVVPFRDMPHSINPAQGFLDNWNTKPSARAFYQQNHGDEYWGTIFRSQRITQLLKKRHAMNVAYLEKIEHSIGTIDNGDNTRPAAAYFIPFLVRAYERLAARHAAIVSPKTHPDLLRAVIALRSWNDVSTLGNPAMSIFMNFLEAYERNVFEGGNFGGELPTSKYTGAINFSDAALKLGTYGGLGGMGTYNLLYHLLAHTHGVLPCGTL